MRNICVVGSGHVGLVTGACLAELGNRVICMDDDFKKVESLKAGVMPFYEPGLEEMVYRNVNNGRLSITTDIKESVEQAEIVFICVGTPQKPTGEADLSYVEAASRSIGEAMNSYKVIVEKSTVPVKTGGWVKRTIRLSNSNFDVVSNPEFLREGKAIHDVMHPDRIVIGVESETSANG